MSTTRFHKAAKDGLLEIFKEATKKDCNHKDEDGMTPTLWAAYEGNLDVLRVIVGRGGDPEKANYHFGQNALHIATSRGHMSCVSFLVTFKVNLWALDHDYHTALDLAVMNGRSEILNYLDTYAAKLENINKRKCEILKDKAHKDARRRLKKFEELSKREREKLKKHIKKLEEECDIKSGNCDLISSNEYLRKLSYETNGQSFTEIVGNGMGSLKKPSASVGIKKIIGRKLKNNTQGKYFSNVGNIKDITEDNNIKSIRRLFEQNHNLENTHLNNYCTTGKRGKIKDLFVIKQQLQRSTSQPDLLHKLPKETVFEKEFPTIHRPDSGSLFDRPGFGSVSFRQILPLTLSTLPLLTTLCYDEDKKNVVRDEECSIGSAGSLSKRILPRHTISWDTNSCIIYTSDEKNCVKNKNEFYLPPPLHRFLLAVGVTEYEPEFIKQRIDMEALFMLTDEDLILLGIPLGPRRKLLNAIKEYKQQSDRCKEIFEL